jgi:hypothetical protein
MLSFKVLLILSFFLSACKTNPSTPTKPDTLTGNWLIISPDHRLKNDFQKTTYGRMQDSIVGLKGLKLVRFNASDEFQQVDSSFGISGNWKLVDNQIIIQRGGKGFEPMKASILDFVKDTLRMVETILLPGDSVQLVWYLKKIPAGSAANSLFSFQENQWRIKPKSPGTDETIRKKTAAILHFYAGYFELISIEAMYFSPKRVFLPLRYYQHGIGLKPLSDSKVFSALFYDLNDAQKAYAMLSAAIRKEPSFPKGENYVIEYARYLRQLEKNLLATP